MREESKTPQSDCLGQLRIDFQQEQLQDRFWKPIETTPLDKFVLFACPSGYRGTKWVFVTGIVRKREDESVRWLNHSYDALGDYGLEPKYWMQLPNDPE